MVYIDAGNKFPIIIHLRSFAPFKKFGPGLAWSGDNRGFSLDSEADSRLTQVSRYETSTGIASNDVYGAFSSSSYGAWAYSDAYYNDISSLGNLDIHMYGNNDAVFPAGALGPTNMIPYDGGPTWDIDLHTNLDISVSDLEESTQLLTISGKISGDQFPNAESFVEDASGNRIFLGVFATQSGPQEGPTITLFGDKNEIMMNIDMQIVTDCDGIFLGVRIDNETIDFCEWNTNFESLTDDEFIERYGEYYDRQSDN